MSINLSQVLVKKFENEAIQAFQDSGKLRSKVRIKDAKGAQKVQFQVLGAVTTQKRTAIQTPIPLADASHTPAVATVENYVVSEMTDIFLNNQVGFDERQELVESFGMAMGRRVDQAIIDALAAHSFTKTVAAGGDNLNVSHFAGAAEALGSDVPDDMRNWLCHDSGFYHFLQESDVKDIDVNFKKPLTDGKLPSYFGFDITKIGDRAEGGLAKTGDDRKNYAWQKSAVGLAMNMEPKITVDWEPSYGAHRVSGYLSLGGVVIQDSGVAEITTDES
jgi:hypothetical protein